MPGVLFFFLGVVLLESAFAGPSPASFLSSQVCGRCHQDIYQAWKGSMHALAVDNQVFKTAYKEVYADTGGEAKYFCLRCHAPTTTVTKDYDLKLPISREGVTCDFCHSIKAITLKNGQAHFQLAPGSIKRGPNGRGVSPQHKVQRSAVHTSSLFCAPCHQGPNNNGLAIRSTYLEWQDSPYANDGQVCQSCHMNSTRGRVVVASRKGADETLPNHKISLSLEKMKRAARVRIKKVERSPRALNLLVEVSNSSAGHMFPTGSPLKKVVLNVLVRSDDGQLFRVSRSYEKGVVDGKERYVKDVRGLMLEGERVVKDSRLAPQEVRLEKFVFPVAKGRDAEINVQLDYSFVPSAFSELNMKAGLAYDTWISYGR